jgi:hypothetical protein
MLDGRIWKDPLTLVRYRNSNGEYLYSEEECPRLFEVYMERAKKIWKAEPEQAEAGPKPPLRTETV